LGGVTVILDIQDGEIKEAILFGEIVSSGRLETLFMGRKK